jgi:DNA-binding XRE family transcriptional regulator
MNFPQFPEDFSKEARARVIEVTIRASRAVVESAPVQTSLQRVWFGQAILGKAAIIVQYIMTVFAALAHETCELGKKDGGWAVDVVDREARELLRLTTMHAVGKYNYSCNLPKLSDLGWIPPEAQALFEKTNEWKQYQDELLEVARMQGSSHPTVESVPSGMTAPGNTLPNQIRALREECPMTIEQLASAVHLAPRNVRRHEAGESQIRAKNIQEYERVFSSKLKREVRLKRPLIVKRPPNVP